MSEKQIRRFPSGAVRSDNRGRERPDLISPYFSLALGEHLGNMADEKGAYNFWLGIPEESAIESLERHLIELKMARHQGDLKAERLAWQGICFNTMAGTHTHEIKRLGIYREVYDKTEYIDAKQSSSFTFGNIVFNKIRRIFFPNAGKIRKENPKHS